MRMRRKKNLEQRLEACSPVLVRPKAGVPIDWAEVFGNHHPLQLEIGCGKGQFIRTLAAQEPDINFVALEIQDNVLITAMEGVMKDSLSNVRFLCLSAELVEELFDNDGVDRIYLNFSCPFPKKRYAKHRLTHHNFLRRYAKILKPYGEIYFKTDNRPFFEFSLNEFCSEDFKLKNITFDLHNSGYEGNIVTEYEKRFSDMGQPIYRLEAVCVPERTAITMPADDCGEELNSILNRFVQSGWELISVPAQAWLNGNGDKRALLAAVLQADEECGRCGCEYDALYKKAAALLRQ